MVASRLIELEKTIAEGLEQFYSVGNALQEVRDNRLYLDAGYETFEVYCKKRWQISQSMGYHLMSASDVVNSLEGEILPTKSSHAAKLHIIKSADLRNKAWAEVLNTGQEITGQLVNRFARKYLLVEKDPEIGQLVLAGTITPEQGINVFKILMLLPPYYREIALKWPTIDPRGLRQLRTLEYDFKDEFLSIIQTGILDNGREAIPVAELTTRDINAFYRRLKWEAAQGQKELVGTIQKQLVSEEAILILDGVGIAEGIVQNKAAKKMVYIFPEGVHTPKQIATLLEKNNYGVLFLATYTKNEPDIRFDDNIYVKPSTINGVKPQYILDMFEQAS